ncbi:hypothetical protein ASPNIDRAFT_43919 [Aspergillus niger ATCC 1015]|uniref:Uncharacterized protein n=1 Tax=Aspergillus niger (strain ATCC 1015 / CBS 113.46 / FGSC A1144 / LSHB Ac4 / NCTC 3858a / NRRL 328 / USDA 3528.7) TaxID=380704 RepID=G3XU37_ASPNA|nr:hypothetical protein ASPNIDRAFT_43919 [Aspergillus niger ATCC 1015]KAI3011351.1 hypothetical protein CBS147345_6276 [Aspergillus niger]SPB46617.1 unnamed protein product [Aspergillus niger]
MPRKQSNTSGKGTKKAPDPSPSTSRPNDIRKSPARTKDSSQERNKETDSAIPLAKADQDATKRIRELEEEIGTLNKRIKVLQTILFEDDKDNRHAENYLKADNEAKPRVVQWASCCPVQWSKAINDIFISANCWAYSHINRDSTRLSLRQKKELISRLDGYCVQDDFDAIASSLPRVPRNSFLITMVKLLFVKECISSFFTNLFWYLVPDPGTEKKSDNGYHWVWTQIFTLYEKIRTSDPSAARPWRLWTTRFSNPSDAFGKAMAAQRKRLVDKICEEFLNQDLVKYLLKSSEETAYHDALVHLQEYFNDAAQTSVIISSHLKYLELENLNSIGHVYSSAKMKLAQYYDPEQRKHRLEGSRILFIDFPAVYICDGRKDSSCRTLGHPAVVYVEDNDEDNDVDDSNSS